jgi:hypothetical protein
MAAVNWDSSLPTMPARDHLVNFGGAANVPILAIAFEPIARQSDK